MKIALLGYGRMGKAVEALAIQEGDIIVSHSDLENPASIEKLSQAECVIDFSSADSVLKHIEMAMQAKKPIVIGSTGWNDKIEEAQLIVKKHEGTALFSPNFSIGVFLFLELLSKSKELFASLPDCDMAGIEYHHKEKKDAPSGTAKNIIKLFDGKLPMSSVRVGSIFGIHQLCIDSPFETITLSHEAKNRDGFAKGALLAARWLINKKGWFGFDEMVRSLYSSHYSL